MDDVDELPVDPHPEALEFVLGPGVSEAELEARFAVWEAEQVATGDLLVPGTAIASALVVVGFAIGDAAAAQFAGNRAMATQVAALAEAVAVARRNPHAYLTPAGMAEPDAEELAERAAALDAALQLHLTPTQVRTRAHEGRVLMESLPEVWAVFVAGNTGYVQASAAVELLAGLTDPAAVARFDAVLAEKAGRLTPGAFRQAARTLRERLLAEPAEVRHTRALTERRVVVEPAEDGMAWIHAYISGVDATRIKARLDATARNISKKQRSKKQRQAGAVHRGRDQIRADLFAGWLAGDGTPTAAKVRPLLFVPLLGLLGTASQPGEPEPGQRNQPTQPAQPAVLQGYGPIDPVTAAQLFSDAAAFRRVGTDPFTGEVLSFDRRRYRPTKAQREWLAVKYGTCSCAGCDRLAVTSDIDHLKEWARDNGPTNESNLIPLCPSDHRLKTLTKFRYKRDPDGTVSVTTPTGHTSRNTPANPLPTDPPF